MAKPIFILEVPKRFTSEEVKEINNYLEIKLHDYHCIVFQYESVDGNIKHSAYTNKNMKEIDYNKLVEKIEKSFN